MPFFIGRLATGTVGVCDEATKTALSATKSEVEAAGSALTTIKSSKGGPKKTWLFGGHIPYQEGGGGVNPPCAKNVIIFRQDVKNI